MNVIMVVALCICSAVFDFLIGYHWNRKRDLRKARLDGMNQGIEYCRDNCHRHFLPHNDRETAVDAAIRREREV